MSRTPVGLSAVVGAGARFELAFPHKWRSPAKLTASHNTPCKFRELPNSRLIFKGIIYPPTSKKSLKTENRASFFRQFYDF